MTVIDVQKDPAGPTMTVTSEFDATPERVFQLWKDPRQLERWWGPPTYPASVGRHELEPGGRVEYSMTGPEGDTHHGYWEVLEVDPPGHLRMRDGFASADGTPNANMPQTVFTVAIEATTGDAGRTRMTITTTFPSTEAFTQMTEMGMEEGIQQALGQIDAILAEG